jgi:hypothetical protein
MSNLSCPSTDLNFLSPNGFMLVVDRMPKVTFFTQEVSLPGISLQPLEQATPLVNVPIPGDKLQFEPLVLNFIVDKNMDNWYESFKWMQGLGHPENHEQYTIENDRGYPEMSELQRNYSDAVLMVLGPNNVPVRTFRFVDCFPISLNGISFVTTNTDVPYVTSSITLQYSYFKLVN